MRNRNEIGAIETVFDGYRFRNRLEARWAVFFKTAGIRYIYEPECFRLPNGKICLPDFYLPDVNMRTTEDMGGIYVEVKPSIPNFDEMDYLYELSRITGKGVLLIEGMPGCSGDGLLVEGYGHYEYSWRPCNCSEENECSIGGYDCRKWWDCCMVFMRCYKCLRVRVQYCTRYEPCEYCLKNTGEESPCDADHPSLVPAVAVARSYRFDERGRISRLTAH
jgi:hypothetical protein